jgi:hypothetical protein
LNRQRGHCHVPCRHSISALHRQHLSVTRRRLGPPPDVG